MLLEKVEYKIEETPRGIWRRFMYPNGRYFSEFRSHTVIFGLPLLHFTRGICPETGKRVVAKGIVAIGRIAVGGIAIGQAAAGLIAIGQASLGILLALGQAGLGLTAIGQLSVGGYFAAGQLAIGETAIGQLAIGKYILAQIGFGSHAWTPEVADPEAVQRFRELWEWLSGSSRPNFTP